jgi:hypothetical protein
MAAIPADMAVEARVVEDTPEAVVIQDTMTATRATVRADRERAAVKAIPTIQPGAAKPPKTEYSVVEANPGHEKAFRT